MAMEEVADATSDKATKKQRLKSLQALIESGEKQANNMKTSNEEYTNRVLETLTTLELMNKLITNFNLFMEAYRIQVELTEQLKIF